MPNTLRYRLNTPLVASQFIDGEAIIINFESGCYYNTAGAGATILQLLEKGLTVDEIVGLHAGRYRTKASELENPIEQYVAKLEEEHVIKADSNVTPQPCSTLLEPAAAHACSEEFPVPSLQRFEDLQDLLLLDPIHDVDGTGWPVAAPPVNRDAA